MEELMKLKERNILIGEGKKIKLFEQTLFKANGEEGLHLWESAVVFSRFLANFPKILERKDVIELGSGCGLLGIAALLYTNCKHFTFSDYNDEVEKNLQKNISINKKNHVHGANDNLETKENEHCLGCCPGRYSYLKLDWRDYEKFKFECYDFILGSELIYAGGHIEELVKLIKNLLKTGGKALITMPEKRSKTKSFLSYVEEAGLECTSKYIEEYQPKCENLFWQVLGGEQNNKIFEDLKSMKIILYEIKKIN